MLGEEKRERGREGSKGEREIGGICFSQAGHGVDIFSLRFLRLSIWTRNNEAQKAWWWNIQFGLQTVL